MDILISFKKVNYECDLCNTKFKCYSSFLFHDRDTHLQKISDTSWIILETYTKLIKNTLRGTFKATITDQMTGSGGDVLQ